MGSPALNVGLYLTVCVGFSAIPAAAMWTWRRRADLAAWAARSARRGDPAPGPALADRTLEQIVQDLHRIAACARTMPEHTTWVRHRGAELAYDDVLVAACRALEIRHELRGLPPGWERDVERLRVEACLESAGMPVRRYRGTVG